MPLTNAEIKALRPRPKSYKRFDGKGLYIETMPTGSKLWRLKYRVGQMEKRIPLGAFPDVSLAEARSLCDIERAKLRQGLDPALEKKQAKLAGKVKAANTFVAVAEEFLAKMAKEKKADTTISKAQWFLDLLTPAIGSMPVSEIDPQMLLAAIKRLEARGNYETAKRVRSFASRVFRFAVASGRASTDPAWALRGALITQPAKHHAAILDPSELGGLLRAIDGFGGHFVTKFALQIAPHVFVRPGELRYAIWQEFNLDEAIWNIPAGRMKTRRPHDVPLSNHVVTLLRQLRELTGPIGFAFPALHTSKRPMSENTINAALRRMGYGKDEMTAHGFRSTASSLLNESNLWNPDAIERALSHGMSNAVRGAYHRGAHWEERVKMAAWWSDHLEDLKQRA